MKILATLFVILFPFNTYSQTCPPSGINFNSQQEIDDFPSNYPGCTNILGSVNIQESSGNTITNIDSLIYLNSISGSLRFISTTNLENISGANNITTIGGFLELHFCQQLTSLEGLNNLQSIGGELKMFSLPLVPSLSPLSNLTSIDGNLSINSVPLLTDLEGLEGISSIGGNLIISSIDDLTSLNGLQNLTSTNGWLTISNNESLPALDGLENLTSINGWLEIRLNDVLTSISGIGNIDPASIQNAFTDDLIINNNPSLSVCHVESVCGVLNISGVTADIHTNASGCDSETEVETACQALPITWSKELKATNRRNTVILSWSVSNQMNNEKFLIERSNDAIHFEAKGSLKGETFSSEEIEYSFADNNPILGSNYYRIKQIDFDGNYQYSNVAVTTIQEDKSITIYPNPITNRVLDIFSGQEQWFQIYSFTGELLLFGTLNEGENLISLFDLNKGCYIIRLEDSTSEKIIIL